MMERLRDMGAVVSYSDPHVPQFPKMREHHFDLSSVALTPDVIAGYDCVLLATDHDRFDYELIQLHAALIVDTRGRYTDVADTIVRA